MALEAFRPMAALVATAALTAACGSSGSSGAAASSESSASRSPTSPSAEATEASPSRVTTTGGKWQTYTSPDRGYSVEFPRDWTVRWAISDWPADGFSYPNDPAVDKWTPATTGESWKLMFVAEQPLLPGETARERTQRFAADNAAQCRLSPARAVQVDSEQGGRQEGTCFGNDSISEVAVVHGARSYLIYVISGAPLKAATLATYEHFLRSFEFS